MDKEKTQTDSDMLMPEIEAPTPHPETIHRQTSKANKMLSFISGLCLLLIMLMVVSGAWLYQKMHQEIATIKQTVSNAQTHLQALTEKAESSVNRMNAFATENKAHQANLEKRYIDIEKVQERLIRLSGKQDWVLNEAYYLVQSAQMQLKMNHDIPTAVAQLKLAAHKISTLEALSSLGDLRTVLQKDITALEAAPVLDKHGLWAKLSALETLFYRLKFKALVDENNLQASEQNIPSQETDRWSNAAKQAWQEFKDLIKITRYDQDVMQPVLTQLEQKQIVRVLMLMTEEAKWAVLKENTIVYHESLKKITELVKAHFEPTPSREILLTSIDDLGDVSLKNTVPDISESLSALQETIDRLSSSHRRQETAS